jgi:hypothetical protein
VEKDTTRRQVPAVLLGTRLHLRDDFHNAFKGAAARKDSLAVRPAVGFLGGGHSFDEYCNFQREHA